MLSEFLSEKYVAQVFILRRFLFRRKRLNIIHIKKKTHVMTKITYHKNLDMKIHIKFIERYQNHNTVNKNALIVLYLDRLDD